MSNLNIQSLKKSAFEFMSEGIWIVDSKLNSLYTNHALHALFHIKKIDSIQDFGSQESNPDFFEFIHLCLNNELEKELKIHLHSGQRVWMSIHAKHLSIPDKITALYFKNIDFPKRLQLEQQHTLRNYTSLFEASPVPIWEEDFSEVKKLLDSLKEQGVVDIREYTKVNPEIIDEIASKIKINKINAAVVKLNEGASKSEVLSSLDKLRTSDFEEIIIKQIEAIFNNELICEFDVKLMTLKGNYRYCWFYWTVVKGNENDYARVFLTTTDMTKRIVEDNLKLQQSHKEIELLIREVHHRVKNNFQIITSLIRLQMENSTVKESEELKLLANRIHSMAAVHDLLYNAKKIDKILFPEYISHLVNLLIETLNTKCTIKTNFKISKIHLSLDQASSIGLIINELVTNSIKHGFNGKKNGLISIEVKINKFNQIQINYSDDGIGIKYVRKKNNSLGLHLVQNLVKQIQGDIQNIEASKGTVYLITFPQ